VGPVDDPYVTWASSPGPITSPAQLDAPPPEVPEVPLPQQPLPQQPLEQLYPHGIDAGPPAPPPAPPDRPSSRMVPGLTSPEGLAPGGPPAPAGPVTAPGESPADHKPFGGDVNPADRAQAIAKMTTAEQAAAVDSMSPDEFTRYSATRNRALMLRQAELEHNAAAADEQRAREDRDMQTAAAHKAAADTQDVMARASRLAATKVDPDRYRNSRGIFGRLADIVAATVAGRFSMYTGGRNLALDAFNKRVDEDIAAQHADIANGWHGIDAKRGDIAAELAQHGDIYKAQETYRMAAYQAALGNMQSELQQYDPAGGTAIGIRTNMDQFHAAQQQALQAFGQQQFKNSLEAQKDTRENALAASTIEKNRQETAIAWAKEENAKNKAKADNTVLTPQQIQQQFPDFPVSAIPAGGATVGDLAKRSELHNRTVEGTNKVTANKMQEVGTQVIGADGNPLTVDGKPDGKPVLMSTQEHAAKLNEKIAGGQDLVTSLSKVRRFLAADPSTVDRTGYAAATTDFENAKFAFAKLHDTKASSRELEAMEDLFGPNFEHYGNRIKDKGVGMAHIDALISDAKGTIANALTRDAKYTGPSVIVDTSKPEQAEITADDRGLKMVLAEPDPSRRKGANAYGGSKWVDVPGGGEQRIPIEYRTQLDTWAADAKGLDAGTLALLQGDLARPPDDSLHQRAVAQIRAAEAKRVTALASLKTAANESNSQGVGVYAGGLLTNLTTEAINAAPGEPEQVR